MILIAKTEKGIIIILLFKNHIYFLRGPTRKTKYKLLLVIKSIECKNKLVSVKVAQLKDRYFSVGGANMTHGT